MSPTQPHHPVLLTYLQPNLEAAFTLYHNHAVAKLEQLGGRLGGVVIALYYITNIVRGTNMKKIDRKASMSQPESHDSGQPTPFHSTIMTYLAFTSCIEVMRILLPAFFLRCATTTWR